MKVISIDELKNKLEALENGLKSKTACFTGHRPQKLPWGFNEADIRFIKMKKKTKKEILKAIKNGYKYFICGMALGFDMMCAEIIIEFQKKYNIELICAIPCENQSKFWNIQQKERYEKIKKQANHIRCIYKTYHKGCMQERNKFMIENSSLVIALFNGQSGGTERTLEFAKLKSLKIVIVN